MTDPLRPCDRCGGTDIDDRIPEEGGLYCVTCGWGIWGEDMTHAEARALWNKRPIEDGLRAESMDDLQRRIGEWQAATFPNPRRSTVPTYLHLRSEIGELGELVEMHEAGEWSDGWQARLGEELADCFLLLCGIASIAGIELRDASERKLAINRARKWGKPNAEGFTEHIPTESDHD